MHTSQTEDAIKLENFSYYNEYKKLLHTSFLLNDQFIELQKTKEEVFSKLTKQIVRHLILKQKMEEFSLVQKSQPSESSQRQKRARRTSNMIEKRYKCPLEKCDKIYGSEGSLQQHMKIKHQQYEKMMEENILKDAEKELTEKFENVL